MKKASIIFCLTLLIAVTAKGQINPVKNLHWYHWYVTPKNCFTLSWAKPDSSLNDTLIGYNIYRDDSLYKFTTDFYHSCNPCDYGSPNDPFCDFLNYTGHFFIGEFYIHVTAVYNHNHIESIYTDSIYNQGIALGIKENIKTEQLAISRISQENASLMIELNKTVESGNITISNLSGQSTSEFKLMNQKNIAIDISKFSPGLYLLNLKTNNTNLSRKIMIK
ncbi:MAG: T9SS type A sorting domain-containing protein [Bacteroidetes bacterium]|nr:T9SS type A sorting domain-containing protein [Bacteroidota bacterium]